MSRRTIFDHTPDGLNRRLRDMERQIADLQRVRSFPQSYVERRNVGSGSTAVIYRVGDQTISSAASASFSPYTGFTRLDFNAVQADDEGWANLAADAITVAVAGRYLVMTNVTWRPVAAPSGQRSAVVAVGSTLLLGHQAEALDMWTTTHSISTVYEASAGDSFTVHVTQNSGSGKDIEAGGFVPHLSVTRLLQ